MCAEGMEFDASSYGSPLADSFGRTIRYLRLSVTDRCDLRCVYCMPHEGAPMSPRAELLTFEETLRSVAIFCRLGVVTVRLTGGEPLLRRGIVELVRRLRDELGIVDLAMSTNATLLASMAADLRAAGIRRLNVSLDSLRPERFREITRGGSLDRVVGGIDAALAAGISEVKINTVALRGYNDDQFGEIVDWAWERGVTPRFIELMPVGTGASQGALFISVTEIVDRLGDRLAEVPRRADTGRGPARYMVSRDDPARRIGFITALGENFCDGCNRVRLTARGEMRPCLATPRGISVRDLIRAGHSDEAVASAIRRTVLGKDVGHHFLEDAEDHHRVHMSGVGG